ncbi:MAG: OmpA family protein [Halocynthiibacter sp.]
MIALIRIAIVGIFALPALAAEIQIPAQATHISDATHPLKAYDFPVQSGVAPIGLRGLTQNVWQVRGTELTVQQLIEPVKEGMIADGVLGLFECTDAQCGGFDFRYDLNLIDEPDMHVTLDDFAYWIGASNDASRYVEIVVSRASQTGFIHVSEYLAKDVKPADVKSVMVEETQSQIGSNPLEILKLNGAWVLQGVVFKSGASNLLEPEIADLGRLAKMLSDHPSLRVRLVGHTDATGGYDGNVDISKKRAQAVRKLLMDSYGVDGARLTAHGIGPLAPRFSNETEDGRQKNRRVEVTLISP